MELTFAVFHAHLNSGQNWKKNVLYRSYPTEGSNFPHSFSICCSIFRSSSRFSNFFGIVTFVNTIFRLFQFQSLENLSEISLIVPMHLFASVNLSNKSRHPKPLESFACLSTWTKVVFEDMKNFHSLEFTSSQSKLCIGSFRKHSCLPSSLLGCSLSLKGAVPSQCLIT